MRTFVVAALAIATSISGGNAARAFPSVTTAVTVPSDVTAIDYRGWGNNGWHGGGRGYHGGRGYYYRDYDHGYYHHHSDTGAVLGGLALGLIVGGVIAQSQNRRSSHAQWCYNRYRSYRAWDNSYQPTYGPRRQC